MADDKMPDEIFVYPPDSDSIGWSDELLVDGQIHYVKHSSLFSEREAHKREVEELRTEIQRLKDKFQPKGCSDVYKFYPPEVS